MANKQQLNNAISKACKYLISLQHKTGYWVFDLEADTTITSEYVLFQRFLGRSISKEIKKRICNYLIGKQLKDGSWPLFEDGNGDISATVKAYFALKILSNPIDSEHMTNARKYILKHGGAIKVNVFTRIALAIFGQIPWHTTPNMPIEIMLLPKWFFFHLSKVSYWSRTVIVPLLILYAKHPVCNLNENEQVSELFLDSPKKIKHLDKFIKSNYRKNCFILLDRVLKKVQPILPSYQKKKAINLAKNWTIKHMMGEGGIGGIFPAMVNAVMALIVLDYPIDHPYVKHGIKVVDDLFLIKDDTAFCQPCVSPVWDTCLALSALMEADFSRDSKEIKSAVKWLFSKFVTKRGDWSDKAKNLEPGAWAFQFENDFYPDADDTPMVLMAIIRAGYLKDKNYITKFEKSIKWLIGMQSSDGGWGAFDIDNNYLYLNNIPFADHGALLDPSTSDLTGRCIELLSMIGYRKDFEPIKRALKFLKKEQEPNGSWYGRWGVNYIYGTWSVLMGLKRIKEDMGQPYIQRAVDWLKSCQNSDGGWGETCYSYNDSKLAGKGKSTPSQTAWALLGLMAANQENNDQVNSNEVKNGISYLFENQGENGKWNDTLYTGTGFPRVFYLNYYGYSQYFPLWALGVYNRLITNNKTCEDEVSLDSLEELPFAQVCV